MSVDKKIFTGKEVTDAIKKACEEFELPQDRLNIEVLETGSTGIFGLIRKKAKIRVGIKEKIGDELEEFQQKVEESRQERTKVVVNKAQAVKPAPVDAESVEDVSEESVILVKDTLISLLDKMGFASDVEVSSKGIEIDCRIDPKFEEYLTGQDGKTLDSIQYLLRKIVARKTPERIKLSVDVGDFRARRKEALKEKALELAVLVKENGKTQVISALNPSERRVVHMVLQDDREIRSRSVGDGLFKKILIYKPGKGGRGDNRRRNTSRGRKNRGNRRNNSNK